jgi:hypothetical protein
VALSRRPGLKVGILFFAVSPLVFSKNQTPLDGLSGHETIRSKSPSPSASHGTGHAHSPTPRSTTNPGWLYLRGSNPRASDGVSSNSVRSKETRGDSMKGRRGFRFMLTG